jgi:hypothetical protein
VTAVVESVLVVIGGVIHCAIRVADLYFDSPSCDLASSTAACWLDEPVGVYRGCLGEGR